MDANEEIKEKLTWLGRNVSEHLDEVEEKRVIKYKGRHLYLGEREDFVVLQKYWNEKFTEIVEVLSEDDYIWLAESNRLVAKFVEKFNQMKMAFDTKYGKKEFMASACYEDLVKIAKRLEERLTKVSRGRAKGTRR